MAKRRVKFSYPPELVTEPIIYHLGTQFRVVTNIRRADITERGGWVILEVEGNEDDIQRGLDWVMAQGVRVDPVGGDIVEG